MKYYIISGERSGDLHASNLVKAISREDTKALFRGTGGEYSQKAGVELYKNYKDIAFMGFFEVAINLRTISRIFREVQLDLLKYKPDVLILVDFGGFNMRMARFAKENNIKVFYYISPKIWAWNQKRAFKIKALVDRMFVIMPFEKDFYQKYDYKVDYVGNPVNDAVSSHQSNPSFLQENHIPDKPLIAILAGSRKQEVTVMLETMVNIVPQFPEHHFVIAAVSNLPKEYYEKYKSKNISVVYDQTYDLLVQAKAAVVTSGTATLETALFEVPQVVCYKTHPVTFFIGKLLVKIKFFSLPNLIADKEVVKELLQDQFTVETVSAELKELIKEGPHRENVLSGYKFIKEILGIENTSAKTASLMTKYLSTDDKK